jgi:two-component system sensor histidine kinase MprB
VLSRASELSSDDVHQITSDMIAQVDELASLVTDLGELARGERSEGAIEVLRLDELTDDSVEIARTHARTKDVTIAFEGEACSVEVRRDRLTRAISNLLSNAIKFSPVGGSVHVSCKNGNVVVEDSGPGVPESERANVFDRFWRSPSARALPGSGLGLAIVEQVALEFGGAVHVGVSTTLGGAKFTLSIPEAD